MVGQLTYALPILPVTETAPAATMPVTRKLYGQTHTP